MFVRRGLGEGKEGGQSGGSEEDEEKVLGLEALQPVFLIFSMMHLLALMVFVVEMCASNCKSESLARQREVVFFTKRNEQYTT